MPQLYIFIYALLYSYVVEVTDFLRQQPVW